MERMSSMDIGSLPDSTWGDIVEQGGLGISFDESPDTVLLTTPGEGGGIAAQLSKRGSTQMRPRNSSLGTSYDAQRPALSTRLRALSTLEARGEIDAMQKGSLKDACDRGALNSPNPRARNRRNRRRLLSSPDNAAGIGEALDRYHNTGGADKAPVQKLLRNSLAAALDASPDPMQHLGDDLQNLMSLDDTGGGNFGDRGSLTRGRADSGGLARFSFGLGDLSYNGAGGAGSAGARRPSVGDLDAGSFPRGSLRGSSLLELRDSAFSFGDEAISHAAALAAGESYRARADSAGESAAGSHFGARGSFVAPKRACRGSRKLTRRPSPQHWDFGASDGAGGPPPPPFFGDDISDEALGRVDWGDNEGGFELELDGVLDAPGSYTGQSPGHRQSARDAGVVVRRRAHGAAAALKRRRSKSGDAPSFASGAKHPPGAARRRSPRRRPAPLPRRAGAGVNREASVVVDVGCLPQLATIPVLPVPQYEALINFNRTKAAAPHHCACASLRAAPPKPGDPPPAKPDVVIIPTQNKDVCKICDTVTWKHAPTQAYFKWCKGCKRFHAIHAFAGKLKASNSPGALRRPRGAPPQPPPPPMAPAPDANPA
ncbi:hypothetical protein JL721_11468 [Aureococcus anophagefferens]|nr:hypothetical protein JL721_11468 [Aureococcus anophagefferens]